MTMPTLSTPTRATPTHAGPASTVRPGGATSCRGPSVPAPRTPAEAGGPAPTGAGRDLAAAARSPTAAQLRAQAGALRALGWSYRRIAQHWQRGYRLNARLAFRLARGWTQDEAARQWNARWPANLKTSKAFSYWESWPAPGGRAPSPDVLQRLAELYLCRPGDLLDGVDYGALDPGREGPAEPRGHRRAAWNGAALPALAPGWGSDPDFELDVGLAFGQEFWHPSGGALRWAPASRPRPWRSGAPAGPSQYSRRSL